VILDVDDQETRDLVARYLVILSLPTTDLQLTTSRARFQQWLGRAVSGSIGGAYAYHPVKRQHLVLINLPRIDRSKAKSLEIVVAEELIHMRDRLDGDLRRHAKHGYDRIAHRVAALTGAGLDEVRECLVKQDRQPYRYHYECPRCRMTIRRRRRGTWSCARCASKFDPKLVLRLVRDDLDAVDLKSG
jgi:predicted SprT family Zn-dependent metalloprotease